MTFNMDCFMHSHTDVALPMLNFEAALCTFRDLWFKTARSDLLEDVLIQTSEAPWNEKGEPWSSEAAVPAHEVAPGEVIHRPIKCGGSLNDEMIALEVKSSVWELVANDMSNMVPGKLDDVLHKMLHNAQSGDQSVYTTMKCR